MTLTMYDCIPSDIPHIPDSPEAVGGYVNGLFAWSTADWDRFPHAHHLTISVNAQTRARCLDVETGDATPQQAPAWLLSHADRSSGLPVIYCDASTLTAVLDAMNAARISRTSYLLWSAHYRNEHICGPKTCGFPQADGTQWTTHSETVDQSLLSDSFWAPPAPIPRGKANFAGSFDLAKLHWQVHGTPGQPVFSPDDRWASAEIQVNIRTGQWRIKPMSWNAPPAGG